MTRRGGARAAAALGAAALLAAAGCGKKAPLRLPDQVKAEAAATPRASVREGELTLRFSVPSRRLFPEREEPWVLARVLRRAGAAPDFVEAGTILEPAGLPFEGELAWVDSGRVPGVALLYRVEFRDARRRRRALSPALAVSWPAVPGAPRSLSASGSPGAVSLSWEPPDPALAGLRYRVYRREGDGGVAEALPGAVAEAPAFVDSRVAAGREYCYEVRAVLEGTGTAVEGPAAPERCASPAGALPPPPPAGVSVRVLGRTFQLTWEPATAPGGVAGYLVYRAAGTGPVERITPQPVAGTVYLDDPGDLPPGTPVRWTVTTVERAPGRGESAMSAPASATVPPR